jgi:hypothetical protein
MGKIISKRTGVYQCDKSAFEMPNASHKGLESQADAEPVRANTIKITVS